jgi:hypothetical protein
MSCRLLVRHPQVSRQQIPRPPVPTIHLCTEPRRMGTRQNKLRYLAALQCRGRRTDSLVTVQPAALRTPMSQLPLLLVALRKRRPRASRLVALQPIRHHRFPLVLPRRARTLSPLLTRLVLALLQADRLAPRQCQPRSAREARPQPLLSAVHLGVVNQMQAPLRRLYSEMLVPCLFRRAVHLRLVRQRQLIYKSRTR